LSLPDGLDTIAGDRGYRFSGGEKQRLALARLLLKAPSVVVLDEATAHLDSESEVAIQRALATALAGRTSLVIAHRLSTVRAADQILVIDSGQIAERGTHDELLAAGGVYAGLYRTQFAPQAALRPFLEEGSGSGSAVHWPGAGSVSVSGKDGSLDASGSAAQGAGCHRGRAARADRRRGRRRASVTGKKSCAQTLSGPGWTGCGHLCGVRSMLVLEPIGSQRESWLPLAGQWRDRGVVLPALGKAMPQPKGAGDEQLDI